MSVECNGVTAYVAAAYVDLDLDIDDAVSMEEIRAREAAKAQQAAAAQSGNTDSTATSSAAVSASASDTQLLAAIIECEAGGGAICRSAGSRRGCNEPCEKWIFSEQYFRCYLPEWTVHSGKKRKTCTGIK